MRIVDLLKKEAVVLNAEVSTKEQLIFIKKLATSKTKLLLKQES